MGNETVAGSFILAKLVLSLSEIIHDSKTDFFYSLFIRFVVIFVIVISILLVLEISNPWLIDW